MAKMMYVYELITKDEYKRIQDSFKARVPNWSKKVLSDDELIEFFNIIISMKIDKFYVLRNLMLFVLLLITGMRIGQALELTIDDIELTDKYIILNIPFFVFSTPIGFKMPRQVDNLSPGFTSTCL